MRYRVRHTLRQWRDLAGLSQTKFGKLIGKNKDTISRWERGVTAPRADEIALIEAVLHINWSEDVIFNAKTVTK